MPEDAEENEEFLKLVHNVLLEVRERGREREIEREREGEKKRERERERDMGVMKARQLICIYFWVHRHMFNKAKWFALTVLMSTRLEMVFPTCYWPNMKSKSNPAYTHILYNLYRKEKNHNKISG